MRRWVVIDNMRGEIIPEQQSFRIASVVEELRVFTAVQRFEMRLAVSAGVEPVELHNSDEYDQRSLHI